jgi:hypothetical protein
MAVKRWDREGNARYGTIVVSVTMNGGDTAENIEIPDYADKTIHVYGSFGNSTVTVTGLNDTAASAQALHRVHDSSLTFSALAAETLALLLENPRYITASCAAGTGLKVVIVAKRNI